MKENCQCAVGYARGPDYIFRDKPPSTIAQTVEFCSPHTSVFPGMKIMPPSHTIDSPSYRTPSYPIAVCGEPCCCLRIYFSCRVFQERARTDDRHRYGLMLADAAGRRRSAVVLMIDFSRHDNADLPFTHQYFDRTLAFCVRNIFQYNHPPWPDLSLGTSYFIRF